MAGFNALTVYKIDNADAVTSAKLRQYAFRPAPSGEVKAWGWVSIDDMTGAEWSRSVPEKGEFMAFALRVDTRKVAAPVLKLHLEEAFREEAAKNAAEGKALSRARKKELKELHTSKLLSKAEPVPASVDVAVDTSAGLVYVGSASTSMLETFEEYFARSFGVKAERLFPADPSEGGRLLRRIYDSPQSAEVDGRKFTVRMSDSETVALAGTGAGSAVSSKAALQSVAAGLAEGMEIVKLHIQVEEEGAPEDACTFTLNSDFAFSGLKVPTPARSGDDDPDAAFLEKLFLVGRVVKVMTGI